MVDAVPQQTGATAAAVRAHRGSDVPDDAALVDAYRRGDDEALRTLVERHQSATYRLCLALLGSPEDAEDATQEVWIAVLRSLPGFRGESRFSTWLYRLTLNTCLKRRRRRLRQALVSEEPAHLPDNPRRHPGAIAEQRWLRRVVAGLLQELPEAMRVAVVLSDVLDLTAPEIAALLHLSLPAVKARIRRGRVQLRAKVEQYCAEAGLSGWRDLMEGP
jgi:RNA polymerase sigma-70 factor (ECF subfamily)